jgi:hypothetical protein
MDRRSRVDPDSDVQTESRMEGQAMFHFKALVRKTASICLLPTWTERNFNLRCLHIYNYAVKELRVT